jgi:hypothetical protein
MMARKNNKVKLDSRIRSIVNARLERKSTGVTSSAAMAAAGNVYYISPIAEDDTVNGRTGTVVRPTKLELRFRAYDSTNINFCRVIVFQDSMNQGVLPSVLDVLLSASITAPYNYLNVEQARRFRILYDHTVGITPSGVNAQTWSKNLPLKGTMHFNTDSGLIAGAGKNSLFAITLGSVDGGIVAYSARLIFTDA